jgi:hypothetical protein
VGAAGHFTQLIHAALFGSSQQHLHLAAFVRVCSGCVQDLKVGIDIVHVEGNMLLGFVGHGIGHFFLGHPHHLNLLDDHGMAGKGQRHVPVGDFLQRDEAPQQVLRGGNITNDPVDNRVGRDRQQRQVEELVSAPGEGEPHQLDRMRTDIDADQWFRGSGPHRPESPGLLVVSSEKQPRLHAMACETSDQATSLHDATLYSYQYES